MSATQRNLQNYICLLMTAGFLSACSDAKEDSICEGNDECVESSYCVNVYNDECPSMEDFENDSYSFSLSSCNLGDGET